jgi:hypothetical protein
VSEPLEIAGVSVHRDERIPEGKIGVSHPDGRVEIVGADELLELGEGYLVTCEFTLSQERKRAVLRNVTAEPGA